MITIIMPAYNEEKGIADSINSIRNQCNPNFELIIVNDGSTDRTAEIIEESIVDDKRIRFINPDHKVGKNGAVNLAFSFMTGDWLYFMGADDQLPLNAIDIWEKAVKDYDPNECIALRGRMQVRSPIKKYDGLILPKNKLRENFSGPITLQSKGLLKYSLPLPEEYPNEDTWWGLCIQTFAKTKKCIDDIIVFYYIHDGNSISRKDSYLTFTKKYHVRYIARSYFLDKYSSLMTDSQISRMRKELECEDLRWKGETLSLIRMNGIAPVEKMRWVIFSKEILYNFKIKYDRFFLGH